MSSQHIVIVGGSSGIGLATARLLLEQGNKVTITGRSADRLESARKTLGSGVSARIMDAANAASLPHAFAAIGNFDHLVLALGSHKGLGPFATMPLEDVKASFEEKVFAHFGAAQAALPHLRKDGSLTLVAAVSAHGASPGTAGIGSANSAVVGLARILAAELKPLRVNVVSPGLIGTTFWDFLSAEQRTAIFSEYAGKTPVGRNGQADDVAPVIALLISNGFMTGQAIVCDGGLSMPG